MLLIKFWNLFYCLISLVIMESERLVGKFGEENFYTTFWPGTQLAGRGTGDATPRNFWKKLSLSWRQIFFNFLKCCLIFRRFLSFLSVFFLLICLSDNMPQTWFTPPTFKPFGTSVTACGSIACYLDNYVYLRSVHLFIIQISF